MLHSSFESLNDVRIVKRVVAAGQERRQMIVDCLGELFELYFQQFNEFEF